MLNIALPKGRLGDKVAALFDSAGLGCAQLSDPGRKLVFEDTGQGLRYMLVKPSDVAIYVAHGAADVGVAGKDVLVEGNYDLYELLDLGFGRCDMCIAAKNGYVEDPTRPVRVATKFPNIASAYYRSINREIEVIKLNGSIEIAPLLGLSDVIVDIVETGATLKENDLRVCEKILPVSARLIANKASYRFAADRIDRMSQTLKGALQ